jgi:hypothetical protein
MYPKTLDEIKAEEENAQLAQGTMPDVQETDDHTTHIYTHRMVMNKNWETWVHLAWHEKLLANQKVQQMQAQQQALNDSMGATQGKPQVGQPQVGAEQKSPLAAASPLKTAMSSDINK